MTERPREKETIDRAAPYGRINGTAFESITLDGLPRFLCYENNTLRIENEIVEAEDDKYRYVAMPIIDTPYHPYEFNTEELKVMQVSDFRLEIEKGFQTVFDILQQFLDTEEQHLKILSAAIVFSYLQHKSKSTPYIYCVGAPESGKSRALRLASHLSYRPMSTVAMAYANTFRYLGKDVDAAGTIIHDEAQGIAKSPELMAIYNSGYTLGSKVARVTGEHNEKQTFYFTYCLKFFAGLQLPRDHAFVSRCIVMKFMQGIPQKEDITDEDEAHFRRVRKGLLVLRLTTAFDSLPAVTSGLRGRSRELYNPLLSVVAGTKWYNDVLNPLILMDKERKLADMESKAGYIARAIVECYQSKVTTMAASLDKFIPNDEVISMLKLHETENAEGKKILASDDLPFTITRQELGKIQSDNLKGGNSVTKIEGRSVRGHIYNPAVIERLKRRYSEEATAATAATPYVSTPTADLTKNDSEHAKEDQESKNFSE